MPRGGKRPGAGKPKGFKHQRTLEKEAARKFLQERVIAQLEPLIEAQIEHAQGVSHFFLRDPKSGQFERITDEKAIETALNSGDEGRYYWIFTKDPSIQAFTDLMNRTFGKPAEHVEVSGADGSPLVIRWAE